MALMAVKGLITSKPLVKLLQLRCIILSDLFSRVFFVYLGPFNEKAGKGKQFLIDSTKTKTAFQDGYFGDKFMRVMEVSHYDQ